MELARQAGWQILFDPEIMRGQLLTAAPDAAPPRTVLDRLLHDRRLEVRWLSERTLMIVPSDSDEPTEAPEVHDIVVTALKWPTMMAETPVSMSVESGRTLATAAMKDMKAVSRRHPELTVIDSSSGQQRLALRGIAGSGEATVGTYYDETAISGPGGTTFDPAAMAPDLDLVDIDRIELLRGPQGTLYGASAMGGVVRVVFNRPDPAAWDGDARLGIEQTEGADIGKSASWVLNAPLVRDRLAARISAYARHVGGYIENSRLGLNHLGQVDKSGGRLAIDWSPDAMTSVLASAIVQHTRVEDATFWYRDQGRYHNNQSTRTPQHNDLEIYNITARRDMDDLSALLTVSRYDWQIVRETDYTTVLSRQKDDPEACSDFFSLDAETSCSSAQYREFDSYVDSRLPGLLYQPMGLDSWNAELRLSSHDEPAPTWTVGAYFERRHEDIRSYALLADAASGTIVRPFDITGLRSLDSTLTQQALFGEWTGRLTETVALTLGSRLFHYRRQTGGKVDIPNRITGTGELEQGRYSSSEVGKNLKALLSYQPSRDLLVYGQASQGYRPGGVNVTPTLSGDLRDYRADRLWNYEVGVKVSALERRLMLNADVYRILWSNMITPVSSENGAFAYNTNIGSAKIDGAEVELVLAPDRKTSFEGRISLLDARLTQDRPIDTTGVIAHEGDRLPNVPRIAFSLGLQRRETLARGMIATARIDVSHTGNMNSGFNRSDPYFERTAARTLTDLQMFLERGNGDVGVSIRNLLGTRSPARVVSGAFGEGQIYGSVPRTFAVEFGYRF